MSSPYPYSYYPICNLVDLVRPAPFRRPLSAAVQRLSMLPHMRWVCVKNGVEDRNPLRDEGNRWGKPSSAFFRRPWGASTTKIDAIFLCNALHLLLLRSLVVAGLEFFAQYAQGQANVIVNSSRDVVGGCCLSDFRDRAGTDCPLGPPLHKSSVELPIPMFGPWTFPCACSFCHSPPP